MKRTVLVLMMLAVLFGSMFAATACAETVLRNGIEVTLTTDKESYHALDVIDAKLTVKNTNSFSVRNVSMEIKAPQGYMLTSNGETDVGNLSAGETQQQQAGMRDTLADAPVLPQTGDDSRMMLWGILFVLSSAALCALVIRHPHGKRIVSLLLCVVLVGPYLLEAAPVLAQENAANEMIMVSKEVLVNGESVLLTGVVMYLEEQKNAQEEQNTLASGLRINDRETYVKVREGDKLAFSGMISASEGAAVSSVQVFVYDAETELPYTIGEKYYATEGLAEAQFDLASVPEMTVGEAFGESDYAMTAGNRYAVMFYAADSNGNSFADMDQEVSGDQGPVINVRVMMDPQNCDHSAKEYTYERDDSVNARMTDNMDDLTHKVEPSYKRYCADCGTYLMNIWGAGTSQEHTMNNGVCTGCGYSAVPMMLASPNSLEKISFESHALGVLAGESYAITWDENGGSDEYIVNVKLLSGEPAYHDEEPGTSLVLNQRRSSNFVWVHVPETARTGQFIKVHVYGESNGIQTEAGNQLYLRVGCEHNDSSSKTVEKYYPIEGDETHHQRIEHYTHKCSECGFVLEETQSDPVVSEHEFYSDGRCSLCRYKKELPCDHEYSNRTLLSTRYEKKDDVYHNIVYTYKVTCRDCDMLIYSSMPEYREEKHVFSGSDTCAICGWNEDYGCSHYNETYTQMKNPQYGHDYLDEYEPLYHWVEWECVLSCADCGEVLEEEWTMSDMLLHDFDSNNRCKDCGYVGEDLIADNTVPRILSFSSSLGTTLTVGQMSTYTAVVYDENLRYVELSLNDELVLDSVMDPVSSTVDVSAWSFAGQAGTYKFIVTAVDYAGNSTTQELTITVVQNDDECLHTTYTDYENGEIKYTDNQDGKTHIWQNGYDRICNTCDESLGVVYGVENTADHDYSNGDECPCGYDRSSCSHTPSETKTYNRHIFAQFDEKQHQTIAVVWDMVCSSCGLTYEMTDTEGDENNPVGLKYDHEWENGKCKVQGCEYECAHAFEDIMLPDGNHKAENGIWESKGESGHWCTSIEWWEKCVNCGLEQKYTQNDPYKGEEQAHMMNTVLKSHYDYDDNAHWLVGEDRQCTANGCGYETYVPFVNGIQEAHSYKNDKCVCGMKREGIYSENNESNGEGALGEENNDFNQNYVYGYQLGYSFDDDFLSSERVYMSEAVKKVWDSLSLDRKRLWFELNVYDCTLKEFEFESYNDEWLKHQMEEVERDVKSGFDNLTETVIGHLLNFDAPLDNGIELARLLIRDEDGLRLGDKVSMARVMMSGWLLEIKRENWYFRVPNYNKLKNATELLDNAQSEQDTIDAINELIQIAELIPGLSEATKGFLEIASYTGTATGLLNENEIEELKTEVKKCEMELLNDAIMNKAIDQGLEEDMQVIIKYLLSETKSEFEQRLETVGNQAVNELSVVADIALGIVSGGIYSVADTIIGLSIDSDDYEKIDEWENMLEGALRVYLKKTKPQVEEAMQTYIDNPTLKNYLSMSNGKTGALDTWLMQTRQLQDLYWSIKGLKEGDGLLYKDEFITECDYVEETYERFTHEKWKTELITWQ